MLSTTTERPLRKGVTFTADTDLERGHSPVPASERKRNHMRRQLSFKISDVNADEFGERDTLKKFLLKDLIFDRDRIQGALTSHREFKVVEGYTMKDLPKFEDLTRYGISTRDEEELWNLEVDRLIDVAKSSKPPVLEGDLKWYGNCDANGYNRLHKLAAQLSHAVNICIHDNELILIENYPALAEDLVFRSCHRGLLLKFDTDTNSLRYGQQLSIGEYNEEAFHAFVDYLTASIVRLLVRSMHGDFWIDNCVSTLARFAAKIKVLAADLPDAFERTLDAYTEHRSRITQSSAFQGAFPGGSSNTGTQEGGDLAKKQQMAFQEDVTVIGGRYFRLKSMFSHSMTNMIGMATSQLIRDDYSGKDADLFEASSIVYDTGFPKQRVHLSQQRNGTIGVSGRLRDVEFAVLSFQFAKETWDEVQGTPIPDPESQCYTSISWTQKSFKTSEDMTNAGRTDNHDPPQSSSSSISQEHTKSPPEWDNQVKVNNMKDAITLLIPYFMYNGTFPSEVARFTSRVKLHSDSSSAVGYYEQKGYLTAARLHTSALDRLEQGSRTSKNSEQQVHETTMAQSIRDERPHINTKEEVESVESWVIDEKSITIPHRWYSAITVFICSLVCGAGVALIAIGDRATGVDPSSLTALSWAAAGFLMVWFKSLRVQDWPWRDFLRGHIVCRSVTEVVSVTRMHPQKLMAILLRFENRFPLTTRGPYNALFDKKAEDGFSIDIPQLNEYAVCGGHIFVSVDTSSGPALVALRANSRTSYNKVEEWEGSEGSIVCKDFDDPREYSLSKAKGELRRTDERVYLYPICREELDWAGVRGIFARQACFD